MKITSDVFAKYKLLSGPLFSPDGKRTGFVVQTTDLENNRYNGDLYLLEHESGTIRRITTQGDAKGFVWTPDGKMLFSAPRGRAFLEAKEQCRPLTVYYAIDPDYGEAVEIASLPIEGGLPVILDDGRWIVTGKVDLNRPDFASMPPAERAVAISDYKNPRYEVFEEVPFWGNGLGYLSGRRNTLFLCDPKKGTAEPITEQTMDVAFSHCAFGKVTYTGCVYDSVAEFYKGLFVFDVATGKTTTLIEQGTYEVTRPQLIDADTVLCSVIPRDSYNYENGDFYRCDLKTGEVGLLKECDWWIGLCAAIGDSRLGAGQTMKVYEGRYYFCLVEDECCYIRSIDKNGNLSERLVGDGVVDMFDVGPQGIVFCGMRGNGLAELYLADGKGNERKLTGFNDFVPQAYQVQTPRPVKYTGSDGWEIRGWVIEPVDYQKGRKYPGVLSVHGGPKAAFSGCFSHEMQMLAAAGYFVFFCNPRGGDGRGRDFSDLNTVIGTVDYVNLMEFADEALRLYPDIDPDRLGVIGGSYGGFMTNWIIGHTQRFAAAVSQRGISNWLTMEGTDDLNFIANKFQFGVMVKDDPQKLWDNSPIKYAHTATTPTLFVHSDEDYRCPKWESMQMFTALRRRDIDTKMVLFHGEHHGLSRQGRPQNRISRLEEILGWLNAHLK